MRISSLSGLAACLAMGTAALTIGGPAHAGTAAAPLVSSTAQLAPAVPLRKPCYTLTKDNEAYGAVSQNFSDTGFDIYDAAGAADFKVGTSCALSAIDTVGVYMNGSGPAASVNVIVYGSAGKTPGSVRKEYDDRTYSDASGLGSLSVHVPRLRLDAGRYWVSVVANMSFATGGEWGWALSYDLLGHPDLWRNPGGGFGVCPDWDTTINCLGVAGDYMITLGS